MLYSEAVRDNQICMQTVLCSGSVKKKESFFGYTFTERFSYSDQIQRTIFE